MRKKKQKLCLKACDRDFLWPVLIPCLTTEETTLFGFSKSCFSPSKRFPMHALLLAPGKQGIARLSCFSILSFNQQCGIRGVVMTSPNASYPAWMQKSSGWNVTCGRRTPCEKTLLTSHDAVMGNLMMKAITSHVRNVLCKG